MKKILILSFFVLGFSSLISQVVVIRELAMSFYANEFFIGWILFCWLLGTGLGSAYGSKLALGAHQASRLLVLGHVLVALIFPLAIAFIRFVKPMLGAPAGTFPELSPSLICSFIVLIPLCGVLGAQFTVASKVQLFQKQEGDPAQVVAWAYLWECLGFVAGGVFFSFMLVFFNEFRVASFLAALNFATAFAAYYLFLGERKNALGLLALVAVLFTSGLYMNSFSLNQRTSQWRFPNEKLIRTENTVHGNVSVTQLGSQYNFYQSGLLLGADREHMASEYLVHFPMLAHPAPKKVLLLGTGFNGPLQEILKHGPEEVRWVELDPELLKITERFLPEDLQASIRDPRVKLGATDPRDFLRGNGELYDVIIANFPDPSSVLVNRNYTEQFFRAIRSHLSSSGVFATHISFAPDTLTPELERLGGLVYATLSRVFKSVTVLPEDTLYFLAMNEGAMSLDHNTLAGRLAERKLRPDFVTANQIRYRFTNDRVERIAAVFQNAKEEVINTDLRPHACYFMFLRWMSQFNPRASKMFSPLAAVPFPAILAVGLLAVLLLGLSVRGSEKRTRRLALVSMGAAGFSLMAFEIVLIYLFQAAFGDLYYRLAWLIMAFMTGLGAGTWTVLRLKRTTERSALVALHILNAAFFFLMIPGCAWLFSAGFFPGEKFQSVFFVAAFFGGLVAGAMFPLANRFFITQGGGKHLGSVYAADLGGSALGALLTAGFFIPVWGVLQTLLLLGALNCFLPLLLFREWSGREGA